MPAYFGGRNPDHCFQVKPWLTTLAELALFLVVLSRPAFAQDNTDSQVGMGGEAKFLAPEQPPADDLIENDTETKSWKRSKLLPTNWFKKDEDRVAFEHIVRDANGQ